jgi:predicted short-subunit dehydrogenase-like oxidoreductase (DUF2520 family)
MTIVLIGSGNIATHLGRRFRQRGHRILQVLSPHTPEGLAAELGAEATREQLRTDADLYILATSDAAIRGIAETLRLPDALVVHTAGAVPMEVLAKISRRYGVLYPLQSLRKEVEKPQPFPFLVDGSDENVKATLAELVDAPVRFCTDQERLLYHLGGVFVNNFPNYLYTLTEAWLREHGQDFSLLLPLMAETARRLGDFSPGEVQTGPALRGDQATLAAHQVLLTNHPELLTWYDLFSVAIARHFSPK